MKIKISFVLVIIAFIDVACISNDLLCNSRLDSLKIDELTLTRRFKINNFRLIFNERFSGVLKIKDYKPDQDLIVISGRYNEKRNGISTFVLLLSCDGKDNLKKEAIFEFYSETIDYLSYKNDKIYVVFKDQTDLFGWIEWHNGKYNFVMFEDPEL